MIDSKDTGAMKKINLNIYSDGGARGNPGPAACAFVVFENGKDIFQNSFYLGKTTNNVAEYKSLLKAYEWLLETYTDRVLLNVNFHLDSQLVVNQLNGKYKIKNSNLIVLAQQAKRYESNLFGSVRYNYVPREKNKLADRLLNDVLDEKL